MKKYLLENQGLPLSVNDVRDLPAMENAAMDSWYVITNFECDGEQLGFCWHHQTICPGPITLTTVECLLMNATRDICIHDTIGAPSSPVNGADKDKVRVYSEWGTFEGDRKQFTLKLELPKGKIDVVLKPKNNVLYNGTTGLIHFIGMDSHQFAFPTMDIEGTMTIEEKEYPIQNATAWFDRQWGFEVSKTETVGAFQEGMYELSWLWIGLPLGDEEAVSIWDVYQLDGRHAFGTFMLNNGIQVNEKADITYDDIWTSARSGKSYPRTIHVSMPVQELDITLKSLVKDPEYVRDGGKGLSGCQGLCKVTGAYKGKQVDRTIVVEMIGDICGEA